jgi:hypothetical protein
MIFGFYRLGQSLHGEKGYRGGTDEENLSPACPDRLEIDVGTGYDWRWSGNQIPSLLTRFGDLTRIFRIPQE